MTPKGRTLSRPSPRGKVAPRSRKRIRGHKARPGVPLSGAPRAPDPPRGKQKKSTASSGGRSGRNLWNKNFLVSCTFPCNFSLHSRRECRDLRRRGERCFLGRFHRPLRRGSRRPGDCRRRGPPAIPAPHRRSKSAENCPARGHGKRGPCFSLEAAAPQGRRGTKNFSGGFF